MSPQRWQQITDIFQNALARDDGERAAFIAETCADDSDLRHEVEKMLKAHHEAGSFIESPAAEDLADMFEDEKKQTPATGEMLNHYRVIKRIGAGGMGEVFLAEDSKLGRRSKFCPKISPQTKNAFDVLNRKPLPLRL